MPVYRACCSHLRPVPFAVQTVHRADSHFGNLLAGGRVWQAINGNTQAPSFAIALICNGAGSVVSRSCFSDGTRATRIEAVVAQGSVLLGPEQKRTGSAIQPGLAVDHQRSCEIRSRTRRRQAFGRKVEASWSRGRCKVNGRNA